MQRPRPNLIVGGRGGPRSIRMAARYADEYNTVNKTADECRSIRAALGAACAEAGRDPIPLSLMTGWLAGDDQAELLDRAGRLAEWRGSDAAPEDFLAELRDSSLAGTLDENVERPARARAAPASSASCSSTCCTATSTRSSRSAGSWRPRSPRPLAREDRDADDLVLAAGLERPLRDEAVGAVLAPGSIVNPAASSAAR